MTLTHSVAARARARREAKFLESFPDLAQMRVLDLGGRPQFWELGTARPKSVTVVNLEQLATAEPWIDVFGGDALDLPMEVRSQTFDLVFSNSLIEHVGGPANRQRCADVVHEMAPRHWVQTPYRYFPIEPHWVFPGLQFLPLAAKAAVTRRWRAGHMYTPDRAESVEVAASVDLVSITEMRTTYPGSEIWFERFGGLVKSLVAVRR